MNYTDSTDRFINEYFHYVDSFEYIPGVTPLSTKEVAVGTSFGYLLVVFILYNLMKPRKAFNLDSIVAIHNFFLGTLSLVMTAGMGFHIFLLLKDSSFQDVVCDLSRTTTNRGGTYFWIYVFYASKYYELLDTVFLCLRKKPLNFLHVYHHWITLLLVFVCLQIELPVQFVAEFLNAFVHIPMYFYYFLSYFKYQPWWKHYITQIQITQFVLTIISQFYGIYLYHYKGYNCRSYGYIPGQVFTVGVIWSYLILFIKFYISTYLSRRSASRTKKE